MSNLGIHAILSLTPSSYGCAPEYDIITRGGSAPLLFDFSRYSYIRDLDSKWDKYISQLTFIFKQGDKIKHYNLHKDINDETAEPFEDKNNNGWDDHFSYDPDDDAVIFLFRSYETAEFNLTTIDNGELIDNAVEFEVAVVANTFDTETDPEKPIEIYDRDTVIIEPQRPIAIVESLYKQAGLAKKNEPYFYSERGN